MKQFTKRALLLALLVLCLFGLSVLAAGAEAVEYENDVAATTAGAVARLGATEGGAVYYTDLVEAITAAPDDETVYVLANTSVGSAYTLADKSVTIKGVADGITLNASNKITLGANAGITLDNLDVTIAVAGKNGFLNVTNASASVVVKDSSFTSTSEVYLIHGFTGAQIALDAANSTFNANVVLAKVQDGAVIGTAEAPAKLTDLTYSYMVFYIYTATVNADIYGGTYSTYFIYAGDSCAANLNLKVNPTGDKNTTINVPYLFYNNASGSNKVNASFYFRNVAITQTKTERALFHNGSAAATYDVEFAENATATGYAKLFNAGATVALKLPADVDGIASAFAAKVDAADSDKVSYYTNVATAIAAANNGDTVYVMANATIPATDITDKALTITGVDKYTITAANGASYAFKLLGTEASLTLNNLAVDVTQTGKNTNAYVFGVSGSAAGTYTFVLNGVDTTWLNGSGAIYGYGSVKTTITLTNSSFAGGAAIINTTTQAQDVSMHLDNVTCADGVLEVNGGAGPVTVTRAILPSTALTYDSDATAIADGAFFRIGATEGGAVYYKDLATAVAEAESGATIYVLANATVTTTASVTGKAITVTGANASVVLTNGGSSYLFAVATSGSLTVSNINVATNGAFVTASGAASAVTVESGVVISGAASATPFINIADSFGTLTMKSGSKLEVTSAPVAISVMKIAAGVTTEIKLEGEIVIGTKDAPVAIPAASTLFSLPRVVQATFGGTINVYVSGQSCTLVESGRTTDDNANAKIYFTGTLNHFVSGYTGTSAMSSMVKDNTNSFGIEVIFDGATLNQGHEGSASGGNAAAYSAVFYMYRSSTTITVKNSVINVGAAGQGHPFVYTHGNTGGNLKLNLVGGSVINILGTTGYAQIIRDKGAVVTATADATGVPVITTTNGITMFAGVSTLTLNDIVIDVNKLGGTIASATNVYFLSDAAAVACGFTFRVNDGVALGGEGAYAAAKKGYYTTFAAAREAATAESGIVYNVSTGKPAMGSYADDDSALEAGLTVRVGNVANKLYAADILAALDLAANGDTIYVLANSTLGAYTLSGKAVTIEAVNADTVITVSGTMTLTNDASLTVKNLSLSTAVAFVTSSTATNGNTVKFENVSISTSAGKDTGFIEVAANCAVAIEVSGGSFTATGERLALVRLVNANSKVTAMKVTGLELNTTLIRVNVATGVVCTPAAPAEITDVMFVQPKGAFIYAYNGAVHANFFGGTFDGQFLYGGDYANNDLTIKFNPTGDKTTTVTRDSGTTSSVYSAWVHLNPNQVKTVEFAFRNLKYTDTGVCPMLAIRNTTTLSISEENSTFTLKGAKLSNLPAACGVKFNTDALAKAYGFDKARIGEEGAGTYFTSLAGACNGAPATGTSTIYVLASHNSSNVGLDNPAHFAKKVNITSAEGGPYTVTFTSLIAFYVGGGAEITFTNITLDISQRFGRFDGSASFIFGAGTVVNHNNAIFTYDNGNCKAPDYSDSNKVYLTDVVQRMEILAGATINVGTKLTGLHYKSDTVAPVTFHMVVAGKLNMNVANPIINDSAKASKFILYYDASTAEVTVGQDLWVANVFRNASGCDIMYAKGFENDEAALAWGAKHLDATAMTVSADPDREWNYTFIQSGQFRHEQYNVLNSFGGTIYQMKTGNSGIFQTAVFENLGTVTVRSYNNAKIIFQDDAWRFRVRGTTLVLDGIEFTSNGASISVEGGTAAAPSVLKLINGAKITGNVTKSTTLLCFGNNGSADYCSLFVDEGCTISQIGATDSNSAVLYTYNTWANGTITIKGTLSTGIDGAGRANVIQIDGVANHASIVLDGATLTTSAKAASGYQIMTAADFAGTVVSADGLPENTTDFLYLVNDDTWTNSFEAALATIPAGGKGTITLLKTLETDATFVVSGKDVTITAVEGATLNYTGAAELFQIDNLGTLTFKDITVNSTSTLVRYLGTSSEIAQADRDIVVNFVNATMNVTGAATTLITSNAHFGDDATKKCDSVTVNVDADSVINFTSESAANIYFISFNHNTHMSVAANIDGAINITVTGDSATAEFCVIRSNNPSATVINVSKTASIVVTLPEGRKTSGKSFFTSCTGGNTTSNKLNIHADAITSEGALTLGGIQMFSAYTTAATFEVTVTAADTKLDALLGAWTGAIYNGGSPLTEAPLAFRAEINGEIVYGRLATLIALVEDKATITLSANHSVLYSTLLSAKEITLTAVEGVVVTNTSANYFVALGDNSVLNVENFKYQGNLFAKYDNAAETTATLTLKKGAAIIGGDPTVANGFIITRGTATNATIVLTIEAGASIIRPASYTLPAEAEASIGIMDFRNGSNTVTLNVYGELKNLTTIPEGGKLYVNGTLHEGANATLFYSNQANTYVNIYEGAEVEGTSDSAAYSGVYQGIFYFAPGTTAKMYIYGGTITAHGRNPLAYFDAPTSYVVIDGAPTINMTELAYGMVRFNKATGTSLTLGFDDGYAININNKEYYCGNAPAIFAISGITPEDAIARGMIYCMDGVYYTTLDEAIAMIPDGESATIEIIKDVTLTTTTVISNKDVTITAAEGVTLSYNGTGDFFQINNLGTLTFKDITVATTSTLVRYLGVSSTIAQADRDIVINFVNATVNVTGSAVSLITSNAHYGDDATKKCDSVTTNVDADSVINFTTASTGDIHFISYNHNTHPYVVANIDGAINITVTGDSDTAAFYVVRSNNPSSTIINVSKTAAIKVTLPDGRKASGASYFTSCTGGNTGSNKLNLHIDAITNEGALTLDGIRLFNAWTAACTFDVTITAANTDLEAKLIALVANNSNSGSNGYTFQPVAFRTQVGNDYVYGTLNALFAATAENGTITVVSSAAQITTATLTGKAVTLTAAQGVTLNVGIAKAITLANGATLTVKNAAIAGAVANVFYVASANNTLTLDGVTVNYTAAAKVNFIGVASGSVAIEIKDSTFTSTNETRIVYANTGAAVTSLKYNNVTSTNGVLAMAQGANAVIGSAAAPAEIVDTTTGLVFYAYDNGTIYANIFGGAFSTLVYGGDGSTVALDIKINPTGDKTTTVTRATASDAGVYSAWVHLNPAAVNTAKFVIRNVNYTDTGAAPLFAVRKATNLYITVENSTFTMSGAKLASYSSADAVHFGTDATARLFGYAARIGAEGGDYYLTVQKAGVAAPTEGTTTIYVVADHTTERFGLDFPNHFAKKIHITSAEGGPYTVTGAAGHILFYLGGGAEVTFTNVIFNLPYRFARFDGDAKVTFGDGCVMNHLGGGDGIFIYNNGGAYADAEKTTLTSSMTNIIDIQKGATINAMSTVTANGLIYHNGAYAENAVKVTIYLAGTVNINNRSFVGDLGSNNGIYRVYVDAKSAVLNTGTAPWICGTSRNVVVFYNGTFEKTEDAVKWAVSTGASALTISNDPAAEYKYSIINCTQFAPGQYNILNAHGGEIWQLKTVSTTYATAHLTNLGTVTFKSYNGATIRFQDNNPRFRIRGTVVVLDGIEILSAGGAFMLYESTEAAPAGLKLINGAKITATAHATNTVNATGGNTGISSPIMIVDNSGSSYAFIEVDETSSITHTGTTGVDAYVIFTYGAWANGHITIKGTVTTNVSGKNVGVLYLNGNGTNALTFDGATISNTGTATGTLTLLEVVGGNTLVYENINDSVLTCSGKKFSVLGAISFKGLTAEEAAAKATEMGLSVGYNGVYSETLSTAIINQVPEGGKAEFQINGTLVLTSPIEIYDRDITLVGNNNAAYDLKFEGAADSVAFIIYTRGVLTLKNMNIWTKAQLVSYNANRKVTGDISTKNITINLVNTDVTATITTRYANDAGYAGALISSSNHFATDRGGCGEQANNVTVNVDKDSSINFTTSSSNAWMIAFNHNSHNYVYANIDGVVTMNATYAGADGTRTTALIRSNNPSATTIVIGETAKITLNISDALKSAPTGIAVSTTGKNNTLTVYLAAITENGALTLDGAKLFISGNATCAYTPCIIANDNSMTSTLTSWTALVSDVEVKPIVAYLEVDNKCHYSSLGGLVNLIPVGGSGTITIDSMIEFSTEISIVDRDITFVGSESFTGDYHLKYTGTDYMFAIYSKGTLTLKNIRIHTTGILVDFNANKKVAGNKADKNTVIKLVNADVVAEGNKTYVFGSRNHYTASAGCGEQANKVDIYIDADSSVTWTTSATANSWFFSFNHNTHTDMNAYIDGQITVNFTAAALNAANEYSFYRVNNPARTEVIISGTAKVVMNYADDSIPHYFGYFHTGTNKLFIDYNAIVDNGAITLDGAYLFNASASCIPTLAIMNAPDTTMQDTIMSWQGYNATSKALVTPIAFRSENSGKYSYGCIGGAAYAAQDGAIITLLRPDFTMTPTTITDKTVTLMGLEAGYIIRNNSTSYLLNIGSGAHLTIVGLTIYGNYIAKFTAAAGTTSSLTLGEGTSIIGGALEKDAYIFYGDSLYGAAVITIKAGASVVRPDTNTLTNASNPCPGIYRFATRGAYTLNVYGELKNLTQIAPGVRAAAQIGYCNSQNGMIVNIYDGAEIEATSDSDQHNGYYQGIFYFAVYGNNKHEFNIYGGTIVSHGTNSMVYFGNYFVTVRIMGTPSIVMPDATYNMICMHNTKSAAESQIEFYADVEVGATIELNGKSFFWHGAPEVSMITAGKFFTDDNAAQYGAGYRIIDEEGNNRYVAGLGAAASMSRNGGTIWVIGDVSDGGSGVVVNKYLYLKPSKPGITITISGSTPVMVINGGSEASPARFYIEGITFAGTSSSTLFSVEGGGRAIIEMTNCNMDGKAGVIQLHDAAVANVTITNGSYKMSYMPFYADGYSEITVNATNITFTQHSVTGDANSLFHLENNAVGHWNIKGGSATTNWHSFYIRSTSTAFVNIEDFSIVSNQWCFSSQSSANWRVNLKNVDMTAKNCTATRMYGAAGSYVNIMGGSITALTKDGTNKATMTFGNSIRVNIFDAYVHSSCMSAISGLASTVNINIYGGTFLYNGTETSYAPIMLPQAGNLTVKGGTFINTSSSGPIFSNLAVAANKLVIEACNAIGKSSYLVMGNATTPTTLLDSFGHANLNGLTMERGARPGNIVGIDPTKGEMTFQASVNKDSYDYLAALSATNTVKFGMLVVPTALLNEGVDFTHFGLKNYINNFGDNLELGVDYFDYAATATEEEDGCWTLKATHTGIEPDDYTTKYSAIFYAEYEVTATDASGNATVTGKTESGVELTTAVVYRYADYEESANARSLAQVAFAAYNNPDEDFDASEKATLATWCGGDPTEKQLDLFLVAGGSNAVGNTPFTKEYADSLINHVCANCGHTADEALFAEAGYTCVNLLVHGKTMKIEDGVCFCTCGYSCDESEAPADMKCPATMVCGAAKATFQNALKDPITNVFYSGVVSDAAGSKSSAVCSAITLGLGWNGNMGPEFGMANELAKYYNADTGKYAAIMKYAVNNAALVEEDAQFGNFSGKLYDNFMQTVSDQIKDYANFGYKVNVVGFYWMQGEADIAKADVYAEALQNLIANVRTDLAEITGADMSALPVVVGEIATFTGSANNADRVALKNAQNAVPGVIVDNTSAYMADANGIFLDAQNMLDTGARVVATILNATNADITIPEIEATTEIIDANGNVLPGHNSLAMSLIAAPSGATITLKDSQIVYTSMNVANRTDLVIDGAGNTVTIATDAPALALQNASVTLENIVINHAGSAAAITVDSTSTLVVEEGTEIAAEYTAIELTGLNSKLEINGGVLTTTGENATSSDAIIRTTNANVTITGGYFEAAEGSSVITIDKNAAHKLIVNVTGGTFVAEDKQVEKKDAQGQLIPGEYDTIEAITFVNNCPTAILVIDPDVLAANPSLDVINAAAQ